MSLRVEKQIEWNRPVKRVFFGLILLAAGVGTLVMGWGSALSWLEIGAAMLLLGTALAHQQGGLPRWKAAAMEADEDGILLEEVRARDPGERRISRIPARLIQGVSLADIAGIANQIRIDTAFGHIQWRAPAQKGEESNDLHALRNLWRDVAYDPDEMPWVDHDSSAFEVADGSITWRQPASIQPLGHMIAVLGPAVAALPLFGKAWGIPFAIIAAISLLLFVNSARHAYRFFGYRCQLTVTEGELRFRRPLKRRSIRLDEIEQIAVHTAELGTPWTIEINAEGFSQMLEGGDSTQVGLLTSLFKSAVRLMRTGWIIHLQDHGPREVIALVAAMHDLADVQFPDEFPERLPVRDIELE